MSKARSRAVPTVVLDWDGTLVEQKWPDMGDWMPGAVDGVRRLHEAGCHLIVFSARLSPFDPWTSRRRDPAIGAKDAQQMRAMLDDAGLTFVRIWQLEGKPGADIYLDDKAERFMPTSRGWRAAVDRILLRLDKDEAVFPAFSQEEAEAYPAPTDLAWLAGFIDGEGCIQINVMPNRCHLRLDITQKDRRPLQQIQKWFGGALSKARADRVSYLRISTKQCADTLRAVRPYLRVKQDQADVAIEFQERRTRNGRGVDRARDIADAQRLKDMKRAYREE